MNSQAFAARRWAPGSPLTDIRGARGRATALRDAVRAALGRGASHGEIQAAVEAASAAGLRMAQQTLF
jgi:hypothetical protein